MWPYFGLHDGTIVCYLNTTENREQLTNLRVIGQRLNYIKIATADLKVTDVVLRTSPHPSWFVGYNRYNITDNTPTHVWILFDKEIMRIVD
jgi:hypothetical protein